MPRWWNRESAAFRLARPTASSEASQECLHRIGELGGPERETAHVVVADRVDEELRPNELEKLAEVHLRHEHLLVTAQHVAGVARERVEVAQMRVCDLLVLRAYAPRGRRDRAVRPAPTQHENLGAAVGDVPCAIRLLEAADPVLEARRPR